MGEVMTGRVSKLLPNYGFVRGDDGESYFLLPWALARGGPQYSGLSVGDRVRFEVEEHPKGLRAAAVQVLQGGSR